ncbi:MAG: sulfatase-like hydrolase/transferase [Actinomycetota bacterium]
MSAFRRHTGGDARHLGRPAGLRGPVTLALATGLLFGFPDSAFRVEQYATVEQSAFQHVPVVMVLFDELPLASLMNEEGDVDPVLFPNFSRLQSESLWLRNATSVGGFTAQALPGLLSGKNPDPDLTASAQAQPHNVFTLLGEAYDIRGVDNVHDFCVVQGCDATAETTQGAGLPGFGFFPRSGRGGEFVSFLQLIEERRQPRFYFLHSVMPHYPWRYLPSGQRYLEVDPIPGEVELPGRGRGWGPDRWLVRQAYQRHLMQTVLVDRMLGALMQKLQEEGIYEETLLVIAADHGISFKPAMAKRWIRPQTTGSVLSIPMFLKMPGQEHGRISDLPVETIDLLPTVADALNLSRVWDDLDGHSALDGSIELDRVRRVEGLYLDPRGREKYEIVKEKYEMLDLDPGTEDLFDIGPGRSEILLGRSLDDLVLGSPTGAAARVPHRATYERSSPQELVFPALLEGTIRGLDGPERRIVAAAVNGRIAAVTRTYRDGGETNFYCMLPPSVFGAPPNRLALYLVDDLDTPALTPLG